MARLCDAAARVSAHYLIDETGHIYALVDETHRAWHAGVAFWAGETDVNGCSIGIELAHSGRAANGKMAAFPENQMRVLLELLADIKSRHHIPAKNYLGHSDVAPMRKTDPSEVFDWSLLAREGFGVVSDAATSDMPILKYGAEGQGVLTLQQNLARFGYGVAPSARFDEATLKTVEAFQRHHRRDKVDGVADAQTYARLLDLLQQTA